VAGIAFNRNFDQPDRPVDTVVYVARYNYTPGSPGGVSTPNSAANPPNFTYAGTTVVDRGAVGFAVPGVVGFAGDFTDKEWMEIDLTHHRPARAPAASTSRTRASMARSATPRQVQSLDERRCDIRPIQGHLDGRPGWHVEKPGR